MVALRSDVTNVAADATRVVLHFGHRAGGSDGAVGVTHLQELELTPYAAKRLHELLQTLLQQHDFDT